MERVTNKAHLNLLARSIAGKWTAEDDAATEAGLAQFEGIELAREVFKENHYRRLKCCICGCDFYDRSGCNPDPVVPITEDGDMPVCCHSCDAMFVIPMREQL